MAQLDKISNKYLRNLDNWPNAPVPICMGGDYRALTWCCKPGHSLTFGFKCMRNKRLKEIGITSKQFMKIKNEFSQEHNWDAPETCFGSLSYCCMRNGGCFRRDGALKRVYAGDNIDTAKAKYFAKKRKLAQKILKAVDNTHKRRVKDLIGEEC